MFAFYRRYCVHTLVLLLLLSFLVSGHSVNNRKLNRVESLTNVKVDIAPRPVSFYTKRGMTSNPLVNSTSKVTDIENDDIIRIQFQAYDQIYALHLEPNTDLLHPQAAFMYKGKQEPIQTRQFYIYRGYAIRTSSTDIRWQKDQLGALSRDDGGDALSENGDGDILGWARVILRHDLTTNDMANPVFEGSFEILNDIYHIKSMDMYHRAKRSDDVTLASSTSSMVVYRDSDTSLVAQQRLGDDFNSLQRRTSPSNVTLATEQQPGCGTDRLTSNYPKQDLHNAFILRPGHPASGHDGLFVPPSSFSMAGHSSLLNKRAPSGCPTTKQIAYMGAAADCTYTKYYQSKQQAQLQIISDWNSVSALYERQFNIQLGLVNITVMDELCPTTPSSEHAWNRGCADDYTLDDRLSDFSRWRGSMSDDGIALWHLLTNCATGVEVGIAWVGQLCQSESSSQTSSTGDTQYVAGAGVSSIIRDEWKVIAHEIGHGFGANHDCNPANCPCSGSGCNCCPLSATVCDAGGSYIMNPTSNVSAQAFSPCSVTTICNKFSSIGTCLQDPGNRTIEALQMCGNGIVEDGEECDPGNQSSSCCDAATCKFINNAMCDDINDSCCNQCQYRSSTYQCRPASTSCDIPEYCTGISGTCPSDVYTQDGTECGTGLKCASGQCTSRDLQCQNRGFTMNVTKACSTSNSCSLSCNNASGSGCLVFSGGLIDGTPCGSNGVCKDGDCDEGSISQRALYWLSTHQNIAIPVGVVLGVLILGSLAWCFYAGCCGCSGWRNRKSKRRIETPMANIPVLEVRTSLPPSSPPSSHYRYGNNRVSSPPPPPPAHQNLKDTADEGYSGQIYSSPVTTSPHAHHHPPSSPPPPPVHVHSHSQL